MKPFKNKASIGNESIAPQYGDPSIKELLKVVYSIKDVIVRNNLIYNDLVANKNQPAVKDLIAKIKEFENIVTKRFGFDIKIKVYMDNTFLFSAISIPLPSSNSNVFYNEISNIVLNAYKNDTISDRSLDRFKEDHSKYKDTIGYLNNSVSSSLLKSNYSKQSAILLHETLNMKGIVIDNNKVYIRGLPKEYYAAINIDFFQMADPELNVTPEEVVAIFLHELGHIYTYISYTYKCVRSSLIIDESVTDYLKTNNGTPNDMIKYVYSSVTGGNIPKSKHTIFMFNELLNVIANPIAIDGEKIAKSNSEIVADQFASRFGYGEHIAAVIQKLVKKNGPYNYDYITMQTFKVRRAYENSILHFITLTVDEISNRNIFLRVMYYIMVALIFFRYLVSDFFNGIGNKGNDQSKESDKYEAPDKRIDRIKKDYIRQIRIYGKNMDKEVVKDILEQIKNLDSITTDINKIVSLPFGERIKNFVMSLYQGEDVKINKSLYDMEILIESITENSLHIYKERLKDLL